MKPEKLDGRTKAGRQEKEKANFRRQILWTVIAGILAGVILSFTLFPDIGKPRPLINPGGSMVKPVNAEPYCEDPISYIRCRGEELGVSNRDIMTLIRISKCESGLREDAINVNKNKSVDGGIFQINSIHGLSLKEVFDYKKNIDYGYKLFLKQGLNPWSASKHCWNK